MLRVGVIICKSASLSDQQKVGPDIAVYRLRQMHEDVHAVRMKSSRTMRIVLGTVKQVNVSLFLARVELPSGGMRLVLPKHACVPKRMLTANRGADLMKS